MVRILGTMLAAISAMAQTAPPAVAEYRWEQMGELVGRRMRTTLASGARIEAEMLQALPDGMKVRVVKTSDGSLQAKGEAVLGRAQMRTFEMRTVRRRAVMTGTLIGLGAGAAAGLAVAQAKPEEGWGIVIVPLIGVGVAAAGTIAGYAIGRSRRWATTKVTIVP